MRIPKRFKLLGHTIEVTESPGMYYDRRAYGKCEWEKHTIKIVPISPSHPVDQTSIEQTFIHEMLHHCLYYTEQAALNDNENFVDMMAAMIHQCLTTMEYEDDCRGGKK
jgi:hypothetical protein